MKVYDKKVELEETYTEWVNADDARKVKYGNALNDIAEGYKILSEYELVSVYQSEAIRRGFLDLS